MWLIWFRMRRNTPVASFVSKFHGSCLKYFIIVSSLIIFSVLPFFYLACPSNTRPVTGINNCIVNPSKILMNQSAPPRSDQFATLSAPFAGQIPASQSIFRSETRNRTSGNLYFPDQRNLRSHQRRLRNPTGHGRFGQIIVSNHSAPLFETGQFQ